MAEDIVSAMHELDVKSIETNFVAKNLSRLPKCDPKDLDPYAAMEMILGLEDRLKKMESTMGETVARQITQAEDIKYVKDSMKTHELILSNTAVPSDPSYKDVVVSNINQLPPTSTINERSDNKVETAGTATNSANNSASSSGENDNVQTTSESDDRPWIRVGRNGRPVYKRNGLQFNSGVRQELQRSENQAQQSHGRRQQQQQQQQQQFRRHRKRVQGSREGEVLEGAPPPKRDFFLSRVKKDTEDEVISTYIASKGIVNSELKLVSNADAKCKSYKLSVNVEYKDKVMCADMWPRGVCIEKWMHKGNRIGNNSSFNDGGDV